MSKGRRGNPSRLNCNGKAKSPYYLWLHKEGRRLFSAQHGEYQPLCPTHPEKMTAIWQNVNPKTKENYYIQCGKKWNGINESETAINDQQKGQAIIPKPQTPSTSRCTSDSRRCPPTTRYSSRSELTFTSFPSPAEVLRIRSSPRTEMDQIHDYESRKLYSRIKYNRQRYMDHPQLCLGMQFYFITVAPTCSIRSFDNVLYTFPSEISILHFSLEEGLIGKESFQVCFNPNFFTNCPSHLENEMLESAHREGAFYNVNPFRGMYLHNALDRYLDFMTNPESPLIYNAGEKELVSSTLRALQYPVSFNDNNLCSLEAFGSIIFRVFKEERHLNLNDDVLKNFIDFLETDVSFVSENYCTAHAQLDIFSNQPNFNCPLAFAYSKIHLLFEYMNQYDMLGISKFYKDTNHMFCLSNVGTTRSDGNTSASNYLDTTEEDIGYTEPSDSLNIVDEFETNLTMNELSDDSTDDFNILREMFAKSENCWVVLPAICFDEIPDLRIEKQMKN